MVQINLYVYISGSTWAHLNLSICRVWSPLINHFSGKFGLYESPLSHSLYGGCTRRLNLYWNFPRLLFPDPIEGTVSTSLPLYPRVYSPRSSHQQPDLCPCSVAATGSCITSHFRVATLRRRFSTSRRNFVGGSSCSTTAPKASPGRMHSNFVSLESLPTEYYYC